METFIAPELKPSILSESNRFEIEHWTQNKLVFGIDEVGRGCLSGPLVVCCVALFAHSRHQLLVDSKILTENKRKRAAEWIKRNSWYSFGIISPEVIDQRNIHQATILGMKRAFYGLLSHPQLPQKPALTLIDAVPLKFDGFKTESFIKGESRSISIAAASILAKVYRDELITRLDTVYPGYKFSENKGYGSKSHQDALCKKGPSIIHRKTFISSFISPAKASGQQSLF
jgi:ribonuclease HII